MKPVLFHDIDGVLFGHYDGAFQMRPGVSTWLEWAYEHFEIVWLTSWPAEKTRALLEVTYNGHLLNRGTFQHANWTCYADKLTWLIEAVQKLKGRDWFWIDDEVPEDLRGLPTFRCMKVNPQGDRELSEVQGELGSRLELPESVWKEQ